MTLLIVKYTTKIKQTKHFKILGVKSVFNNITGVKTLKCTLVQALRLCIGQRSKGGVEV
jgi:hypothetical protein